MSASSLFPSLSLLLGLSTQLAWAAPTPTETILPIIRHTSLPEVPGANIDRSSLKVGNGGVLVHYISNDVDFAAATQAILTIHGVDRDANNSFASVHEAVKQANKSNIVVMAPVFFNGYDKGAFPWVKGKATSNELVWKGDGWFEGANNQYPTNVDSVSSFDAIDAAIAYLTNKYKFPLLQHIVLAGHSAGGQTIQRYTILCDDPPTGITLRHVIANPSSFAYFSPKRLKQVPANCTTFNDWKYGLKNYQYTYHADLLSTHASRVQMRVRYLTREIRYLYGTADLDADDRSCEAKVQGAGHLERGQLFWKYLTETYPGPWIDHIQKTEYVQGVGHDAFAMWKSNEGLDALFSL